MIKAIITAAIVVFGFKIFAQNPLDHVLTEVEKNNTSLSALRKIMDAEKIGNKAGLAPPNPEVEFNYLWGNPSAIGNRIDFSIRQSFDFPTAYSYKSQISDLKNEQAELEYKKQRSVILHQTRLICVNLIYQNALKVEFAKRYADALKVADAYNAKYSKGDAGILDYNKAQVNLLNVTKESANIEIERNTLLSELATLNGGNSINFNDSLFVMQPVPADFEQWFTSVEASNPLVQWVKQEIAIASKEVKLNTAMSLPKFYGGFMSEKITGQLFQGVTAGITIPLWENKNTVKYAKAKAIAIQSMESDVKLRFYNDMKATHGQVVALQNNATGFRSKLAMFSNNELLEKAFLKGEISLTEYTYEVSLFYESIYKLLEMEKNLHIEIAKLNKYQ
jgi:outer membrane protein TolC